MTYYFLTQNLYREYYSNTKQPASLSSPVINLHPYMPLISTTKVSVSDSSPLSFACLSHATAALRARWPPSAFVVPLPLLSAYCHCTPSCSEYDND